VARGHRLNQVERLAAAALADDDAVRAHPERRMEELAYGDAAVPVLVRLRRLEGEDVRLL
jgi:hypothetical protein